MAAVPHVGRASDVSSSTTHQLYEQYGRQIYAYCLHRLRSREEAEDAVQTTFLNAFRALQKGTQTQFEQAWLFKIAQNVCLERAESSGRRLRVESPSDLQVLQETAPAHAAQDPEQLIGIETALEAMPANQRKAILLREWQGLSYREIGEELGLSQASVEMLIFRARRSLASALEQPQPEHAKKRRTGGLGLNIGSLVTALKTLFTGGAAVKAVAVAVTAGAVAVTGSKPAIHAVLHHQARPHASALGATTIAPVAVVQPAASTARGVRPVRHALKKHAAVARDAARAQVEAPLVVAPVHAAHAAAPAIDEPTTTAVQTTASAPPPVAPAPTPAADPVAPAVQPTSTSSSDAPTTTSTPKPKPKSSGGGTGAATAATTTTTPTTTTPADGAGDPGTGATAPADPGAGDQSGSAAPGATSAGGDGRHHHGDGQGGGGSQQNRDQQGTDQQGSSQQAGNQQNGSQQSTDQQGSDQSGSQGQAGGAGNGQGNGAGHGHGHDQASGPSGGDPGNSPGNGGGGDGHDHGHGGGDGNGGGGGDQGGGHGHGHGH